MLGHVTVLATLRIVSFLANGGMMVETWLAEKLEQ